MPNSASIQMPCPPTAKTVLVIKPVPKSSDPGAAYKKLSGTSTLKVGGSAGTKNHGGGNGRNKRKNDADSDNTTSNLSANPQSFNNPASTTNRARRQFLPDTLIIDLI